MIAALVLAGAFLFGSIPFGLIVSRLFFKTDIRNAGSGNIGAANALRTLGKKAGAAVLVLDAIKGAVPVLVAAHVASWLAPLAGLAAVAGHCYSPWLHFRGGKGVATYLGAIAALSPLYGVGFGLVWIFIWWRTSFASLASMLATFAVTMWIAIGAYSRPTGYADVVFGFASLGIILWRHRENIDRLRAGTESKLSFSRKPA